MERRIRLSEANNSLVPSTIPGSLAGKLSSPSPILPKCSFNITSSTKCGDIAIPMTKYCQKHILNDPNQVLFRQCGTGKEFFWVFCHLGTIFGAELGNNLI